METAEDGRWVGRECEFCLECFEFLVLIESSRRCCKYGTVYDSQRRRKFRRECCPRHMGGKSFKSKWSPELNTFRRSCDIGIQGFHSRCSQSNAVSVVGTDASPPQAEVRKLRECSGWSQNSITCT